MVSFSNAKINLGLNIVSRRSDGYHNIETVFYPIPMRDVLELVPMKKGVDIKQGYRLFQSGIEIKGKPEDNLIIKALNLVKKVRNIPDIDIHLLKTIPFGAGLGGGSSNAAVMLKMLNQKFNLELSQETLLDMAVQIGADCSFFIKNRPAFATGIGEQMEEVELSLDNYHFLLIKPEITINTKWAYSVITPQEPETSLHQVIKHPITDWKKIMHNDFEKPIFQKYPIVKDIKRELYNMGALYASMSGSGSSVYAFFEEKPMMNPNFKDFFTWSYNPINSMS